MGSAGAPDSGRAQFGHSVDVPAAPENVKLPESGEDYGCRSIMYDVLHMQVVVLENVHRPLTGGSVACACAEGKMRFRHN